MTKMLWLVDIILELFTSHLVNFINIVHRVLFYFCLFHLRFPDFTGHMSDIEEPANVHISPRYYDLQQTFFLSVGVLDVFSLLVRHRLTSLAYFVPYKVYSEYKKSIKTSKEYGNMTPDVT